MSRSNPRVLAAQGVYILATILKSKKATEVSIRIMDTFVKSNSYHDGFIIIDRKRVFHCKVSFKGLGAKCFEINEIENKIEIDKLVNEVIRNCSIDN